jgi:hypothetical protein
MFSNISEIEALGFWSSVLVEWIKELWRRTSKCECGHRQLWHLSSSGGHFKECTKRDCGCVKGVGNTLLLDKDESDPTVIQDARNLVQYEISDERAKELYEQIRNVADEYVNDSELSKKLVNAIHYHFVGDRPCSSPKVISLSEKGDRPAKLVYASDGDSFDARLAGYEAADVSWRLDREAQRKKLEDAGFLPDLDLSMDDQWYVEGNLVSYCKYIPTPEEVMQRIADMDE